IKASVTALIGAARWNDLSHLPIEGQHELLQVIDEESDRLKRFIEALSHARHPEASQPPHLRAVPLEKIVRAGLARAETITRDHRIAVGLEPNLPAVCVDSPSIAEA